MANIKDVAKHAGVAVGTVSRYLNGADIKEVNKVKIDEAIKSLDFKLNQIARTLKTNKTFTIGVVIPDLTDIYSTTIVSSIERELYKHGYNIFVCDSWGSSEIEFKKVNILLDKQIDGLIIYPAMEDISYLKTLKNKKIPLVTIDLKVKGFECDQILTDNINATYSATEWLINNNHKKIGIISGNRNYFTAGERLKGYERALEAYGISIDEKFIKTKDFSERSGYEGLQELMNLEEPPTAIIACNYYTTIGVVKAIYDLGLKIPQQISIIGFDNLGITEMVRPALSIIVQPMEEVGVMAAQLLLKRIKGDYNDFPKISRLKASFIIKESTRKLD